MVTLTVSPDPAVAGQPVTLTATIAPAEGNAYIAFLDGNTPLNQQELYSEKATFTSTFTPGTHQIAALFPAYLGIGSASAAVTLTVKPAAGGQLIQGPVVTTGNAVPGQILTSDIDHDGYTDVLALNAGGGVIALQGNAQGSFGPRQGRGFPRLGSEYFSRGRQLLVFLDPHSHSDPLNQLLTHLQFGDIRLAAGQPGIDEFLPEQLVCRQAEKNLEFRHREPHSDECQMPTLPVIRRFVTPRSRATGERAIRADGSERFRRVR